ncbi:hypothetical protein [Planomonospora parontospora]|uniref:hypothetical protein n=1 Tax=Planomonospora parontospora TaxID=58119 RepID=UPI00167087A9|nr:hypothetical protein [Planomonospora parontospora]GGL42363.1 hypothetical protein GCM10014719_49590 [Planomonospora parontospora subsp. antibiotica]GII18402.1 hypothetical protein Ppa05_51280 [Planomonospora parontospora subsp. antibiotica]
MRPYLSRLATAMYGPQAETATAAYGINTLTEPPPWLRGMEAGVVAATPAAADGPRPDVVVASTCVDHCDADPGRLAATVLADLVHGAAVAGLLGRPLLSFIGIGEEIHLVPGGGDLAARWHETADRVADLFRGLAVPPGSRIVSTADADLWRALNDVVEADRVRLPDDELGGLYHLLDGSCFPRGTPFRYFYAYYRANIAHYRRPVVEHLMGPAPGGILVVENLQQVKAVAVARRLNGDWPTEHLATLPAPDRTGRTRATRSGRRDGVPLDAFLDDPMGVLEGVGPDVRAFWLITRDLHRRSRAEGMVP